MIPIHLPDGKIFRLGFPPTIKKGNWYLGVKCKKCFNPILVLDDPSDGKDTLILTGTGKLSIPCTKCEHEDLYDGSTIESFKATFNYKSFRDLRVSSSGSNRRPFYPQYKKASVTFGIGAIEQRPEAAQIITRCITYWTYVEVSTARLLASILQANTKPAVAMYLSLQNNRTKRDVMNAAADAVMNEKDKLLFDAIMRYKSSVEKSRNDLAHGIFGISRSIPTGLIWVDTASHTERDVIIAAFGQEKYDQKSRSRMFVYELGDLETIAVEIEDLEAQISYFTGYLGSRDEEFRNKRYPELCSHPRVKNELLKVK